MPKPERLPNAILENVRLGFRNFAGKEDQYNREGDRNFAIFFDDENRRVAEALQADGYNIKMTRMRDDIEDYEPVPFLKVKVSYKVRAPKIFLVTKRGKTPIGEGEVSMLDWVEYTNVDVVINPYYYEMNGGGITAYLQSMYITIVEDALDEKYGDTPTVGTVMSKPSFSYDDGE